MKIGNCTIDNNGDVSYGLQYLEDNWDSAEVKDILANSRKASDQLTHFSAFVHGSTQHYILKHTGYDTYFLEPNN